MIVPESLAPSNAYVIAALRPPAGRFAAMFGEVEYAGENGTYSLSTQVGIIGPKELSKTGETTRRP